MPDSTARAAFATLTAALLLGGCCELRPWTCRPSGNLVAPVAEPYLLVQPPGEDGESKIEVVYLPDPSRELVIRPDRYNREGYDVELAPAGYVTRLAGRARVEVRSRRPGAEGSEGWVFLPELPSSPAPSPGGEHLRPGLYRMHWPAGAPGGVPQLEAVAFFTPEEEQEQATGQPTARYDPGAGSPEMVSEILVDLAGADPETVAEVVRVFRDDEDVTDDCRIEPRGTELVIRTPPTHRSRFGHYRVQISPLAFVADLPASDDLESLMPRAEIRLLEEGPDGPRFVIDYAPGQGSPVSLRDTRQNLSVEGGGPEAGSFRVTEADDGSHLLESAEAPTEPMTVSVTPVNSAGLAGDTVSLHYQPPPRPRRPPTVRRANLEMLDRERIGFEIDIEDLDRLVDVPATERGNRAVNPALTLTCSQADGEVACAGQFPAGARLPEIPIFCRDGDTCLTATFSGGG